jgi:MFS family permease
MSERETRALIRDLAGDLTPVQPLPRLRLLAAAVLLLWLAIGVVGVALQGLAPTFWRTLAMPISAGGIFAGLLVAGVGGVLATLALAIPGRDRLARGAFALGGAGIAIAAGVGIALLARSPLAEWRWPAGHDLPCLAVALAIGLAPALALGWLAGRAAPFRPLAIALAAATGAAALGVSVAQATCPADDAMHLMLGHVLVPAVGALVLTLPLLVAIRRAERARHT